MRDEIVIAKYTLSVSAFFFVVKGISLEALISAAHGHHMKCPLPIAVQKVQINNFQHPFWYCALRFIPRQCLEELPKIA